MTTKRETRDVRIGENVHIGNNVRIHGVVVAPTESTEEKKPAGETSVEDSK